MVHRLSIVGDGPELMTACGQAHSRNLPELVTAGHHRVSKRSRDAGHLSRRGRLCPELRYLRLNHGPPGA
jgi:hypothetical protein